MVDALFATAALYGTVVFVDYGFKFGRRIMFRELNKSEKGHIIYDDTIYLALPLPFDWIYSAIKYKTTDLYIDKK